MGAADEHDADGTQVHGQFPGYQMEYSSERLCQARGCDHRGVGLANNLERGLEPGHICDYRTVNLLGDEVGISQAKD